MLYFSQNYSDVQAEDPLAIAAGLVEQRDHLLNTVSADNLHFYVPRIKAWLNFFNQRFSECLLMYNPIVMAVAQAFKQEGMITTQTRHEFELSLDFFELLLQENKHIEARSVDEARLLIQVSVVWARYHGLVCNSLLKALSMLGNRASRENVLHMFKYLFLRFDSMQVDSFIQNLDLLSIQETEFLMYLVQGNSLRKFENLPLPVSRKETYLVQAYAMPQFNFHSDRIYKMIIVGKLLKIWNDPNLVKQFLHSNRHFYQDFKRFAKDFDFWLEAYNFLHRINWYLTTFNMREVIDFFIHMKYEVDVHFQVKNLSYKRVYQRLRDWHTRLAVGLESDDLFNPWYEREETMVYLNNEEFFFELINTGYQLKLESQMMAHCAFSYLENCKNGHTRIWSVKRGGWGSKNHLLTVEVYGATIVQVSGYKNAKPSPNEVEVVKRWAIIQLYRYAF